MNKLKIITICYNTPDLIEPQYKSFKKNIKDDFEYIVYDTTMTHPSTRMYTFKVQEICERLGIKRIEVPSETYQLVSNEGQISYPNWDTSQRAGKGITFAIQDSMDENADWILLVDMDVFTIKPIFISDFYSWDIVGIPSVRIDRYSQNILYFTNQIFLLNSKKIKDKRMIDFSPTMINETNVDCGGKLYYLFKIQPELTHYGLNNSLLADRDNEFLNGEDVLEFRNKDYDIINRHIPQMHDYVEIFNLSFLHFRSGTNWIDLEENDERFENLYSFLNKII